MRWTDFIRRSRQTGPALSSDIGQWIEAALLVLLLIQVARLLWALVTPVGLFGEWRARVPVVVGADARGALFAGFDPFFRSGITVGPNQTPVQQVTSLPLKLYGIRINEASGQGSAIIANEGGQQTSYAVGEEISPGVILKAVQFDHVIIERGGATEQLYIDQSGGAAEASASPTPGAAPVAPGSPGQNSPMGGASIGPPPPPLNGQAQPQPPAQPPANPLSGVSFAPRTEAGRVTGIVPSTQDGAAFARAGFRSGDIIVQVNGQPIRSAGDAQSLQGLVRPGARISLMVERGSATVPINLILPDAR
ncbi:type II secretion system protein N [Sphingobium nicotianae]|uniref:PDZ domain-containing protein n=1 Tax=Sphingobium nicotianae TaxID=2782607 RepID=A0A9X1DBR9_9SPHN|nr:type II secretion system protein N [Sphingobium nicotianae]MBT2187150.1 PDZ domain-containing protein [Sphingobium nicotianae]